MKESKMDTILRQPENMPGNGAHLTYLLAQGRFCQHVIGDLYVKVD